jgi:hypothetical protein
MIIYVLDDGETYTLAEPIPIAVTDKQLTAIEGGAKVYQVVPDWADRPRYLCNCMQCTKTRWDNYHLINAQNKAKDQT